MKIAILSPWVGDGRSIATAYRPAVSAAWPLSGWSDATGTHVVPVASDLAVVECRCGDDTAASILAHPTWGVAVLWCDGLLPPDEPPTDAGYAAAVAAFAASLGLSEAYIRSAIGDGPGGRTRRQVGRQIAEWLRERPPAE